MTEPATTIHSRSAEALRLFLISSVARRDGTDAWIDADIIADLEPPAAAGGLIRARAKGEGTD